MERKSWNHSKKWPRHGGGVEGISPGQYGSSMSKGINGRDGSSRLTGEYSLLAET
jgi:hypothetical protein